MNLDRTFSEPKQLGNFPIRSPFDHQLHHPGLSGRQPELLGSGFHRTLFPVARSGCGC